MARALLLALALAAPLAAQEPSETPAPAGQAAQQELPRVVSIAVVGAKRYREENLAEALGQKVGERLDPRAISRGIETLWRNFHVRAETSVREVPGGVELRLSVVEMPVDLTPRFVGNDDIDEETLLRWAELQERGELYLYQAPRVRQRLLEGYRQEGYAFAEVDIVARGTDPDAEERPDVIFEIREGPQVRVSDVVVRGNVSMPAKGALWWKDGLVSLSDIELGGPHLFNWKGSKFVDSVLQGDLLAMREVYRDRGWWDAVVEVERFDYSADRSRVVVHVVVDEGQRYRVSKFDIRGVERVVDAQAPGGLRQEPAELQFPEEELRALCKLQPGKYYERSLERADRLALQEHYGERGYPSHPSLGLDSWEFLDPELRFDLEQHTVEVTYLIDAGRKRYLREVLFAGAEHTRDRVLRREVDVQPGQIVDMTEVRRSLRRVYGTGYFSDELTPLEHRDPTFRFLSVPGEPDWVDLEYRVEEGRVVDFQLQGGVDTNNGLFARIQLAMRNFDIADPPSSLARAFSEIYGKEAFHGAGQTLELILSPGTVRDEYRLRFVEPDLFRTHFDRYSLDLEAGLFERSYDEYDERRARIRGLIGRNFGREFSAAAGFGVTEVDISDLDATLTGILQPDEVLLPPSLIAQEGESYLVGPQVVLNYRDVDTQINPTQGFKARWDNQLYGGVFGGDWDFVRSRVDLDQYWRLGGTSEDDVVPRVHLGLGLGIADPYGDTEDTPYSERYFLGGGRILRGFAYRGVGPSVNGVPLGGETAVDATLEFRIPLNTVTQPGTYIQKEVFHLLFFADAGILDPDPWRLDPEELRASLGFGFGLSFPIPVSLNFGFPVREGDGDDLQTFSFSILNLSF